jgi:hypothetical protein
VEGLQKAKSKLLFREAGHFLNKTKLGALVAHLSQDRIHTFNLFARSAIYFAVENAVRYQDFLWVKIFVVYSSCDAV